MKYSLVIILYFLINSYASSETYNGKIVFKADVVVDASDIEVINDNLVYKKSWKSEKDTVKLSEIDYLLSREKSYILEGVGLGIGLGVFVHVLVGEKEDFLSYVGVSTIIMTLAGAALNDYKKIDITGRLSTSFLNGVSFIPQTNTANYHLVNFSLNL